MRLKLLLSLVAFTAMASALLFGPAIFGPSEPSAEATLLSEVKESTAFVPGELIVKFRRELARSEMAAHAESAGASLSRPLRLPQYAVVSVPEGREVEFAERLRNAPGVELVELNAIREWALTPNDPSFSYQWHLQQIDMANAWDIATGSGVTVAILDSGVAYEDCTPAVCGDTFVQAPDLSGTVFTAGYDFLNGDAHPNDDEGHGTHVAGTIAQTTNNGQGMAGVAFGATIMPVKVGDEYGVSVSAAVDGIVWSTDNGADVMNLSFGGASVSSERDAINYALTNGVTIVAAAGNDGSAVLACPACYPGVIAVGATRYDQTLTWYSSYGSGESGHTIDLVAPGGDTAVDQNGDGNPDGVLQETFADYCTGSSPIDYTVFSDCFAQGTSMASPHVAGVAALMLSLNPSLTSTQVADILTSTATDLGAPGYDLFYGYGLVDAYAAVLQASQITPTATFTTTPATTPTPTETSTPGGTPAPTDATERVSVDSAGSEGNSASYSPAMSADGRYVAFRSGASNLVSGDTNGQWDIFVHDRQTGTTERVSVDSAGNEANGESWPPDISSDGRYVAFESDASNLVSGDTNATKDVFVHDRVTGTTERVSVDSAGNQGNSESRTSAISADGRYVAFYSYATNLVPGDTAGAADVFVHDRQTGTTERVSVNGAGIQGNFGSYVPTISADARYVAFFSYATNLVPGDTNGTRDIFVHDRQTGATERVSVDSAGSQANNESWISVISGDGRYVAFESLATNLVSGDTNAKWDIFVHDRQTGATERVSVDSAGNQANWESQQPAISADGRYVAFHSIAPTLVPGDTNGDRDVFVHDRQTGATERASVDSAGGQANDVSGYPAMTADGRYVAFYSRASNLVSGDTNAAFDIFVHDRLLPWWTPTPTPTPTITSTPTITPTPTVSPTSTVTPIFSPTPIPPATYTVDSTGDAGDSDTGDGLCDDGAGNCTLRAAIEQANANAGADEIDFSIAGAGPHTISPGSALPIITDPVTIDGTSEPDFAGAPIIELNGSGAGAAAEGLSITAGSSTIKGLVINRFARSGILLQANGGNTIEGNYIGTGVAGTADLGNYYGVYISGAPSNTIGGTTAGARNVISGNNYGVFIFASGATENKVEGNYIGTDKNGTTALGNTYTGVYISSVPSNTIGGTAAGAGNVISGNSNGVSIGGSGATGNQVQGNYIGTDVSGTADLGNTNIGVTFGGSNNTIGGTASGAGNVISGNDQYGVYLGGSAPGNKVEGNYIGTDVTGTAPLGNYYGVFFYSGASSFTIGGTAAGAGNVISGNDSDGIYFHGSGATGNLVQGNYIGTDVTGTADLGNEDGVSISGFGNTVGGTAPGARNVISGNDVSGVYIYGSGSTGNLVQGNYIGTDVTGTADLGNSFNGVYIQSAPTNTVGGTAAGAGNVISGNDRYGVEIYQSVATGNQVQGNYIGTDKNGTTALGNRYGGVNISRAPGNTIGGTTTGARNVISGNGSPSYNATGVYISDSGATGNLVQGNYIGTDVTGTTDLGNSRYGVYIGGVPGNTIGGTAAGAGNVISGNDRYGVYIYGSGAAGNLVQGNYIGTDVNGTAALGNSWGVFISDAPGNTIGGTVAGARNIISGNDERGVYIYGSGATGNLVQGNYIGTDVTGTAPLGNSWGVHIQSASSNTIGGRRPARGTSSPATASA